MSQIIMFLVTSRFRGKNMAYLPHTYGGGLGLVMTESWFNK